MQTCLGNRMQTWMENRVCNSLKRWIENGWRNKWRYVWQTCGKHIWENMWTFVYKNECTICEQMNKKMNRRKVVRENQWPKDWKFETKLSKIINDELKGKQQKNECKFDVGEDHHCQSTHCLMSAFPRRWIDW